MRYAETGYDLEIDLSLGSIERVETDPELTELHLGGQGTAAKILWDRVPPEVEPFSPDNVLIFSTGLLVGTPVPGANRTDVSTITPVNGLYKDSVFGGFFASELKQAGYDKIIIRGKASSPVYLWIQNNKVEIRDADHLRGKGTSETVNLLRQELKEPKAQVAAIGLAGENRVYMASIEHLNGSASRGVGAVMGDKGLKAIAVRGTKDINIARPPELFELCTRMYKEVHDNGRCGDGFAYVDEEFGVRWHLDNFAWGNARTRRPGYWTPELGEKYDKLREKYVIRGTACYNCPKECHQVVSVPGRRMYFRKCYSAMVYMMGAFSEMEFNYDIVSLTQEYGLDAYSTPQVLAFGIELYEAGILTDNDLPGFPSNPEDRFYYLLEKMVRREGIGDALANGVYWAARQIGNGAEAFDHNTVKKFEQVPLKLGRVNYLFYLMHGTGDKANITQIEGSFPQMPIADIEKRKAYVKGWDAAPEKFKKYFMEWEPRKDQSIEACVNICDWNEIMHYVDDSTGMCAFLSSFAGQLGPKPPFHIYNYPQFISLASGIELDSDKLWEIAKRNRNLVRAINVRRGLRRIDDKPPEDHWKKRNPEMEEKVLDAYYEFKGWNKAGIPTKKMLDELGLDYVSEDLIERGILRDTEEVPSKEAVTEKE